MPQQVAQNKIALIAILFGVFVVLGYFAFQRSNNQQIDNDDNSETNQVVLTQSDLTELLETKNLGIALLENEKLEQSIAKFKEVIQKSPTEPLGPQNLSVSLLMQLEAEAARISKEDLNRLVEQTRQAVKQLQSIEPDSATSYLFSAKLAGIEKQNNTQISQLLEATQRDQNAPSIWYALSESYLQSDVPENNKQAAAALLKAHQLDRKNLFLLTELLLLQSQEKDLAIKQSLTLTLNVIQPFIPSIKKMTRLDANALIEETLILINENSDTAQWKQATRNIRILVNVLKPEDLLQSDRRRISKNMLEYIRFQFSDSLTKRLQEIETTQNDILAISFTKPDPENLLPKSSSIRSFQLGDFNLNNKTDIIVLTDNQLTVWSQTDENAKWKQITQFPLEQPVDSFILVDLDGDIEQEQNTTILNKSVNPRLQTGPQFDADLDIILIGANGIRMLENIRDAKTGVRSLVLVNKSPLLKELASAKKVLPIDFDHDGDLDLCIAIQNSLTLWKQLSAFEFQQVSHESILPKQEIDVHSLIAVDWDRDVDLDIVVGTSQGQHLGLLENMKHGRFRWKEFQIEQLTEESIADLQVFDFDANASWDLLLATQAGLQIVSTETSPTGHVTLSSAKKISQIPSTGIHLSDFDNNGWLDILSNGEKTQQILLADARGTFSEQIPVSDLESIRLSRSADFDRDGDLDLCVLHSDSGQSGNDSIQILHNQGGNKNHWIEIGLRAEQIKGNQRSASGRVNHYGIGSLLELKAERLFQPRTITSQTTHFGLGQHAQADVLRILWTNGIPINVIEPDTNSRFYEKQTLKGSCPYLYAWNGQKYDFVTDLLWAAPLGLITPTGSIAPHREWEYLLITGDQLKPQAGSYNLQITEELWEAAYFDTVQLIAIDHPADVQIYSNEKVGPAHLATFGIHTVQNARQPKSIVNQHDDNLLELVSKRDDLYAKAFHAKQMQGIVEKNYMEIDLGKLKDPKSIKLFLTGWYMPSDTSINVSIAQDSTTLPPAPLSLSVPDQSGHWQQVMPFTGFPGGKTKTIVLDISEVFLTDDYRVRLSCEQEFYWDHIFYTVDEQPVECVQTRCQLSSADLHYRGYSQIVPHPQFGPEDYEYDQVTQSPKWPPMQGKFTRFGNVKDLIQNKDERLVILGAGDELSLCFEQPDKPLPAGWKRDFFLYNVGWDKDADLNTVYGQTVDPLPFYRMSRYPFATEEDFRNAVSHQGDQTEYHTRRQSRSRFWNALKYQTAQ